MPQELPELSPLQSRIVQSGNYSFIRDQKWLRLSIPGEVGYVPLSLFRYRAESVVVVCNALMQPHPLQGGYSVLVVNTAAGHLAFCPGITASSLSPNCTKTLFVPIRWCGFLSPIADFTLPEPADGDGCFSHRIACHVRYLCTGEEFDNPTVHAIASTVQELLLV